MEVSYGRRDLVNLNVDSSIGKFWALLQGGREVKFLKKH